MPDLRTFVNPKKRNQTWATSAKKFIKRRIPITGWIKRYSREDAIGDLIAGVTVALTFTPQSIAYAALAGLDPQYGLNSAFAGSLIYVFFGTIREIVIGPSSLMALLTYQYTSHLNVDFVVLLTFLVGVTEFLMGVFQLGFLVSFISAPVVSGFTTATALIVAISQVKGLLGLTLETSGIFDNLTKIFQNVNNVRLGDTILGVTCILCLLLLRKLKDVRISKSIKGREIIHSSFWFISTGRNAIAVIATSYLTFWYTKNDLQPPFITTKNVETGIPSMMAPPITTQIGNQTYNLQEMISELGISYVVISIVSVLANVAIAKVYVSSTIDASQEIMVLSACNIAGSFFQAIPSCGAFSRCGLISASGVRTPLAGLYSAGLTLMALRFLSPFFHLIPRSTLSAVLISAVIFLVDGKIFKPLWIADARLELATVIATAFVGLFIGVEIGLLFGVIVGLFSLLYKWARPKISVIRTQTPFGEYVQVRPESGIYFPSVDYILSLVTKLVEDDDGNGLPIVMDCKGIKGTDYTTAKGFVAITEMLEKRKRQLVFLDATSECQKIWKSAGIKNERFWISQYLMDNLYECIDRVEEENEMALLEVTND
ncbi:hypothetical protein GE061_005273 [Apolygus lucorum]|uniref:SLC26A/SulP transporter domain-containing protein n=1 Tax=Apolygus lucorum TaxID=248454 RepID=A0A6A4IU32_APOLU|nr:hypothetical protein GE061_005273 [Apolygus lucorum]